MKTLYLAVALALLLALVWPMPGAAQPHPDTPTAPDQTPGSQPGVIVTDPRWDVSLDGRIGIPRGYVKVGENQINGTKLQLHDNLGIDMTGALEVGAAFHFTSRDAIRGTFLYYFLDGGTTVPHSIVYNGETFGPGHCRYQHRLLSRQPGL